ncbi:MAG: transposase [Burkholderiales bacterium]|nr:transposase [Burkholderiales bacterium]
MAAAQIGTAYTVSDRSERLLCEQLGYNMVFRWLVGWGMKDAVWDHSTCA